jgi:hypothetical protein
VRTYDSLVLGWEFLAEDEAIDGAIDKYGKDLTTSVAYCAFETFGDLGGPEHRFWFDLFVKLAKSDHVGWA